MKQSDLFPKRTKPRFCNWVLLEPVVKICKKPAVVTIHQAAYCSLHAAEASKLFGKSLPI